MDSSGWNVPGEGEMQSCSRRVSRFVCKVGARRCISPKQIHVQTRARACTRAHKRTYNGAPLFTRIPFSIDPLCARSGIVRSWLPALLGLFIRLPVAATLFKASQDSCPGFHPPPSFPILVSFALLPFSLSSSLL